jgi:hypothetical protein
LVWVVVRAVSNRVTCPSILTLSGTECTCTSPNLSL